MEPILKYKRKIQTYRRRVKDDNGEIRTHALKEEWISNPSPYHFLASNMLVATIGKASMNDVHYLF